MKLLLLISVYFTAFNKADAFFTNKMKIIFKTYEENQNMINEGASTVRTTFGGGIAAQTSKIKESLNDICYEQIKDNFYYGKFGEFRLVVDKNTGCFNATKLCTDGGKEFRKWARLDRAKELITFFENTRSDDDTNRRPDDVVGGKDDKSCRPEVAGSFYEIKLQNNDILNKKITGQYVQKEFILDIASWISPAFYFKCSKIVNYFFIELYKKNLELKDQQLKEANERADEYKEMALDFQTLAISNCKLGQTQVIYIATSDNYARQNRFKVGGVQSKKHLKRRLSTYNGRSAEGDMFYYTNVWLVIEYRQIEERLKCLLGRFRDKKHKEMYIMYYPDISYVVNYLVDHLSDEVEEVNAKLAEFIMNYPKKGIKVPLPPRVILDDEEDNIEVEVVDEEIVTEEEIEKLREMLTVFLRKLPITQKEITKKEVFDKLKVKNRNEKLYVLKEVIQDVRPDMVLKSKRTQPERVAKEGMKKKVYPK